MFSNCFSPFLNLSCEEVFFAQAKSPTLFLYRNEKSIIIGRNQNPWKEIHIDRMNEDNVTLFRRRTGGGTVYQDLGNTCFSFINPDSPQNYKVLNNSIIFRALKSLDINAEASGRNDLLVNGKKISGSAYKIQTSHNQLQTIHHGTMLIKTDTQALLKYLNPNKAKLESKGVTSVASRVANLTDFNSKITHENFSNAMEKSFREQYPDVENIDFDPMPIGTIEKANDYKRWEWVYGESPQFSNHVETRFQWGIMDMHFDVIEGVIEKCKVFSDCLYPDFIEFVEKYLLKQRYGKEMIEGLRGNSAEEHKEMTEELCEWLLHNS